MNNSVHKLSFSSIKNNTPSSKSKAKFLSAASVHNSLISSKEENARGVEDLAIEENSLFFSHTREFSTLVEAAAAALDSTPTELIEKTHKFSTKLEATNALPIRLEKNLRLHKLSIAEACNKISDLPAPLLLDLVSLSHKVSITLCEVDQNEGPVLRKTCFANRNKRKVQILVRARGSFALVASRFCSSGGPTKLGDPLQGRSIRRGSSGISLLSDIGMSAPSVRRVSGVLHKAKMSAFALNSPPLNPVTSIVGAQPSTAKQTSSFFSEKHRVISQMDIDFGKRLSLRSEPFANLVVQENDDESSSPQLEPIQRPKPYKANQEVPTLNQIKPRLSFRSESAVPWLPADIAGLGIQMDGHSFARPFRPKRRQSMPAGSPLTKQKPTKIEPVILDVGVERLEGRLKFFDHRKKYGFIVVEATQEEYFCHFDDFKNSGISLGALKEILRSSTLLDFECLSYIGRYSRSRKAVNIKVVGKERD